MAFTIEELGVLEEAMKVVHQTENSLSCYSLPLNPHLKINMLMLDVRIAEEKAKLQAEAKKTEEAKKEAKTE